MNDALPDPELWLDAHGDALYAFALRRLGEAHRAEDAVQETLLAGLQARQRFAGDAAERTWLMGILRHKVTDQLRRQYRDGAGADQSEAAADDALFDGSGHWRSPIAPWADPERSLEQGQFWEALEACLDALPPRLGRAFLLKEVDGLGGAEVCEALSLTRGNLWVMLSRARRRLRQCLRFLSRAAGALAGRSERPDSPLKLPGDARERIRRRLRER